MIADHSRLSEIVEESINAYLVKQDPFNHFSMSVLLPIMINMTRRKTSLRQLIGSSCIVKQSARQMSQPYGRKTLNPIICMPRRIKERADIGAK